jgi:hypothetical protein
VRGTGFTQVWSQVSFGLYRAVVATEERVPDLQGICPCCIRWVLYWQNAMRGRKWKGEHGFPSRFRTCFECQPAMYGYASISLQYTNQICIFYCFAKLRFDFARHESTIKHECLCQCTDSPHNMLVFGGKI